MLLREKAALTLALSLGEPRAAGCGRCTRGQASGAPPHRRPPAAARAVAARARLQAAARPWRALVMVEAVVVETVAVVVVAVVAVAVVVAAAAAAVAAASPHSVCEACYLMLTHATTSCYLMLTHATTSTPTYPYRHQGAVLRVSEPTSPFGADAADVVRLRLRLRLRLWLWLWLTLTLTLTLTSAPRGRGCCPSSLRARRCRSCTIAAACARSTRRRSARAGSPTCTPTEGWCCWRRSPFSRSWRSSGSSRGRVMRAAYRR